MRPPRAPWPISHARRYEIGEPRQRAGPALSADLHELRTGQPHSLGCAWPCFEESGDTSQTREEQHGRDDEQPFLDEGHRYPPLVSPSGTPDFSEPRSVRHRNFFKMHNNLPSIVHRNCQWDYPRVGLSMTTASGRETAGYCGATA
jgi:hypothetical protein